MHALFPSALISSRLSRPAPSGRQRHWVAGATTCALLLLSPVAGVAADFTGTWEGKIRCVGSTSAGDEFGGIVEGVTIEITQSGSDLNTFISGFGTPFPMDGLQFTSSGDSRRARVTLTNCANNGIAGDSTDEVWYFDAVVGRPARMRGRRVATQSNAISDCKLRFKRIDAADPAILSDCVVPACGDASSRCVFVTSLDYTASQIGGAAGADAHCQSIADGTPELPSGTYRAWVSDSTTSPSARFVQSSVPYKMLDGTTVASNWTDLTDGTLSAAIGISEQGTAHAGGSFTHTGTLEDGTYLFGTSCADWTDDGAAGTTCGHAFFTNFQWTRGNPCSCSTPAKLYCFQQ